MVSIDKEAFKKFQLSLPPFVKKQMMLSVVISLAILLLSVAYFIAAQPELPILYSLARPNQQLVPKYWLFVFPIASLLINALHTVIVSLLKGYDQVLLRLFVLFTDIIQILLFLALVRIVYITW